MEWVEFTARTVEEAKDLALDRLGVAADDAEFEVLGEPKPGLFGRLRGEARVRLYPAEAPARSARSKCNRLLHAIVERRFMAVLIDAINVKRRTLFELDNTPFSCLEAEVNTPTARGGQTRGSKHGAVTPKNEQKLRGVRHALASLTFRTIR